jgi:hypothetical protein
MRDNSPQNPEDIIADKTLNRARELYIDTNSVTLTDEQKAEFLPYKVETVSEIILLMALAMKETNNDLLIEMHDRLMVSDLSLAYDVLIVMLKLRDSNKMYYDFVEYTTHSKIHSKGVYHRCLGAIGFYDFKHGGYDNPILGNEYVRDFGNGINGITINEDTDLNSYRVTATELYRDYIANKYSVLINNLARI